MNKLSVIFMTVSAFLFGIFVGQFLGNGLEIGNKNIVVNNYGKEASEEDFNALEESIDDDDDYSF